MPLISIIVPVYNVEKYLPKCLESIIAQTFSDFEAILVNDGSTDNSGNICDSYAKKDKRFVVIHKENGGQSSARNAALRVVKGKYIGFVDSDDYIAPDMYSFLYKSIVEYNSDISVCSFYKVDKNGQIQKNKPAGTIKHMDKEEATRTLFGREHFENYIWDKLYKSTLFDDILFPENQLYEDIAIMYRLFDKCKSIVYLSEPKYYYVHRQGSSVNCKFNLSKLKFVEESQKIIEFSRSKGGIYDKEAESCFILSNLWCLYEAVIENENYSSTIEVFCANLHNYYRSAMKNNYIRKTDKLSIFLLEHGLRPNVVGRIHSFAKHLKITCNAVKKYIPST